jgi:thiol-disulfide isomerase/thioredoxin
MMKFLLVLALPILVADYSYCQDRKVELWEIDQLQRYMKWEENDSKLKVVNFWATWCAPCIKELPYYEEVNADYQRSVEVLLVSLDFSDELDRKVIPFLEKRKIKSNVVIMANEKYNEWIDKVDSSWTGAIPATLFITDDGSHHFYEREFEREELFSLIDKLKPKQDKP